MLWDCSEGDARSIAASITRCPMCGKERGMPKSTTAGPSNANAVEGETGYVAPEEAEEAEVSGDVNDDIAGQPEVPETPEAPAADAKVPAKAKAAQGGSGPKSAESKKG